MAVIGDMIQNRLDWCDDVLAVGEQYKEEIAEGLAEMTPLDASEWEKVIEAELHTLREAKVELKEKAMALARERADTTEHRNERDQIVTDLKNEIEAKRTFFRLNGGETAVARYGLDDRTPRGYSDVARFTENTIRALREADETIEGQGGTETTTAKLADDLQPLFDDYTALVDEIQSDVKEEEQLYLEREDALDHCEDVYRGVAGNLEGKLRMIGRHDIADRVHPTRRRASGAASPDEVDTPEDIESGGDSTESGGDSTESGGGQNESGGDQRDSGGQSGETTSDSGGGSPGS